MKLPQLSLRELFLLVVIAAMGCGWWVDRRNLRASFEADIKQWAGWSKADGDKWRKRSIEYEDRIAELEKQLAAK